MPNVTKTQLQRPGPCPRCDDDHIQASCLAPFGVYGGCRSARAIWDAATAAERETDCCDVCGGSGLSTRPICVGCKAPSGDAASLNQRALGMAADAIEREAERREGAILVALKQAVRDQTIAHMEIVSTPDPVVEFARAVVASLRERAAQESQS